MAPDTQDLQIEWVRTDKLQAKRAATANALRSSLRWFFTYCHEAGYIAQNPARLVRRARCAPPVPRSLSEASQERLLAALTAGESKEVRRDRVLFGIMLATGVRLGSALALDVGDVDLERGEVRLRQVKGGGEQVVYLNEQLRQPLYMRISHPSNLPSARLLTPSGYRWTPAQRNHHPGSLAGSSGDDPT